VAFKGALVAALAVLTAQFGSVPAKAVTFGADDRRAVPRQQGAESGPIGMLFFDAGDGQFAAGTAFLVSPCHVMTAYHVAAGGGRVDETKGSVFYLGQGTLGPDLPDLAHFATSTPAHPVAWGRFVHATDNSALLVRSESVERNGWEDWALLKLDTCLGAPEYGYGYLKLAPITTQEVLRSGALLPARSLGLPGDKTTATLWEDPNCRIIGQIYASGWQHDCVTIPGNSGGPILVLDPVTKETRVAAISVSVMAVEGVETAESYAMTLPANDPNYYDYLAVAVPAASFAERIAPFLSKDARIADFVARTRTDIHYGSGDNREAGQAVADLGQAIAANPKRADLHLLRAIWDRYADRDDAAREDLDRALALQEDFAPARYLRGRMALEQGDETGQKAALADFSLLAVDHPNSPDLMLYRGIAAARLKQYQQAIADFDSVLKRQPESAVAVNERGDAWRALRDYDKALADYGKAINFAGDWPEAYRDRGYLYHIEARYDEARGDFDRAIRLNRGDAEAWNGRALVYLAEGKTEKAIADFNRALKLIPESGAYYANRATARLIDGDLDRAVADFQLAVAKDPEEPFLRLLLFVAEARNGDREDAAGRLEAYVQEHKDPAWPRPIVDLFLDRGSVADVEKAAQQGKAEDVAGQRFDADFYLGQWAMLNGDENAAALRFKSVYDSRLREYLEFDIARAELDGLDIPGKQAALKPNKPLINAGSKQ
jgi:tetratricopeptide (TPR) repeat protein